jgi:hypothetical protein
MIKDNFYYPRHHKEKATRTRNKEPLPFNCDDLESARSPALRTQGPDALDREDWLRNEANRGNDNREQCGHVHKAMLDISL